ncbi:MAG: ABC transporter permease [Candidatus Celaenobacter antarcticus]|nr:ABC transporter permease [Candidatus Celaenobacter antarcticus]
MLKNYFKIAFRNLIRHRIFTFINVLGLAIGLVCFILIMLWIQDELSFDRHNSNFEQIYRIGTDTKMGEQEETGTWTAIPLGPALMEEIPEIESAVRLKGNYENLVSFEETSFLLDKIYYTDTEIFDVFSIPLISGSSSDLLTRPKTIVITESTAKQFFKNEDPIGKTLKFDNKTEYEIVGVAKDWPANSHWHFQILASFCTLRSYTDTNWLSHNLLTYIKTTEGVDEKVLSEKINDLFVQKADPLFQQALGTSIKEWEKSGNYYHLRLTPLAKIYLFSPSDNAVGKKGDIRYVYLFAVIGFFILLVACINFMNLTTARSAVRAKEIGIRKVVGSSRKQLIKQFLMESVLISLLSMIIALIGIELLLPYFNNFTAKSLQMNFAGNFSFPAYFFLAVLIGFIAGGYSAFTLSSFRILSILKGNLFKGKQKVGFRNALVLFQFTISIIVIICTIISVQQMKFINNKKLGFDKDHLLVIERAHILKDQLPVFKEEILTSPAIISASAAFSVPGSCSDGSMYNKDNNTPDELYYFFRLCGDYDYLETMGIPLQEGRIFSQTNEADKNSIIINEAAVRKLGYENPIGRKLIEPGSDEELTIIGVVKDFHYGSLLEEISPLIIFHPSVWWKEFMTIRIQPENVAGTLDFLKEKWGELAGDQPFEYFFMDSYFNNLHKSEQRTRNFFTIFATLAIFIACLGLFGLAAFTAEQKTKEIGVRKVLGATIPNIVSILLRQFTRWVILANIIAWPIGYYIMKTWLQNFAYHIDLSLGYFILAGLITLLIAITTVSYLAINAAIKNPITALKYE